jgi:hypothetical protein
MQANENLDIPTHAVVVRETDSVEAGLVARLEALLTREVELSSAYRTLLLNYQKMGRDRRQIRAELRRLHTEEGAVLLEIKLHRARKGRGGEWAEFLRERKPKPLSRTTADRIARKNIVLNKQNMRWECEGKSELTR